MDRDEIFGKVRDVIVEALAVDEDEVTPEATLFGDLGAESIDMLDISFQLEKAFGFSIQQGELFPEGVAQDPEYVQDGKLTATGIAELKARMPHVDLTALDNDPRLEAVREVFTVDTLVNFVENKLKAAA